MVLIKAIAKNPIILIILAIALFFVLPELFFFDQNGFELSCENGNYLGINVVPMPPFSIVDIPKDSNCNATVEAFDGDTLVCTGSSSSSSKTIVVPCDDLDKYIGKELMLRYSVVNNENEYSNELSVSVDN